MYKRQSALFNGTKDHDKATANATVTVKSTIFGNDTTLYFRNGTQYMLSLIHIFGGALGDAVVHFLHVDVLDTETGGKQGDFHFLFQLVVNGHRCV